MKDKSHITIYTDVDDVLMRISTSVMHLGKYSVIAALLVIFFALGVYYMYSSNNSGSNSQTYNQSATFFTTVSSSNTTTGTSGEVVEGKNNTNIWDLTPEYTVIRLTHTQPPDPYPPPVLINGTYYDFDYAKFHFEYRVLNKTLTFNVTWSSEEVSYTAKCHDFINGQDIIGSLDNTLKITYSYNFTNGYWFRAQIYLPENSTALDYLIILPFPPLEVEATPHGAEHFVLGAKFTSSDPSSNGEWTSSQVLLPMVIASECTPIVKGTPEAYSFKNEISLMNNHDIAVTFMPFEIASPQGILSQLNKTIKSPSAFEAYSYYYYKVTPIGTVKYPGIGFNVEAYNLTFWTEPDYVHGYYIIVSQSIIPILYHAEFPQGDYMDGSTVTVTIKLLDANIHPVPWTQS